MAKVTFDGPNKLIIVDNGITELDVQIDLYSDWKEWMSLSDNNKFLYAMRSTGGDPTTGIKYVAPYFFLCNGWKIRPYEGDHTLLLTGNLFVDEPEMWGGNALVHTVGDFQVLANISTTSDATIIESNGGNGGITEEDKTDIIEGVWNESLVNHQIIGSASMLLRQILGLVQENFYIDNTIYTASKLTSSRIRIYSNAQSVGTNNNVLSTYLLTAIYDTSNNLQTYKMVKQ